MGGSSKKQTVGYKYYLGMHMILCHGPVDFLRKIYVDTKTAFNGVLESGQISINQPNLFGGEKREGGVVGAVDFEPGDPTQTRNDYLQARLGSSIPAFRGVVGVVLRQVYLGVNPYLKRWAFRVQRVHVRQDGIAQWYDSKSEIGSAAFENIENFSQGLAPYNLDSGSLSDFSIVSTPYGLGMKETSNVGGSSITRSITSGQPLQVKFKFIINSVGDDDAGRIYLLNQNGDPILQLVTVRQANIDPLRRPQINPPYGGTGVPVASSQLTTGVWYDFVMTFDWGSGGSVFAEIYLGASLVGSATVGLTGSDTVSQLRFQIDTQNSGTGSSTFADIQVLFASGDMNPAHIIRECLTDPDWGMGYQDSDIDDVSFTAAADALYDEVMGISLLWDRQNTIEAFVQEIIKHIDGALYVDRTTGKFVLKLIRYDYDENSLLELNETNIATIENLKRATFGELINSVSVNYWDSKTGETASLTAQDTALAQMQNGVINTTVQYPGFTNSIIAARVAERDLKALSSPLWSCSIYADKTADSLDIGDVFKLSWSDYGLDSVIMRVTGMSFGNGKSNRVKLLCTQDVFALPTQAAISAPPADDGWTPIDNTALPVPLRLIQEAPYYELVQLLGQTAIDDDLTNNPDLGYLMASGIRPSAEGSINAAVYVDSGGGYEDSDTMDFSPSAQLDGDITAGQKTFSIKNVENIDEIELGTHCQIGDELCRVDAISASSITVGRSVLDTAAVPHFDNDYIVFWDAYPASDEVEYTASDSLNVKLLTTTGEGVLDESSAPTDNLVMDSRAIRPYPPGNVKLNGEYFPVEISGLANIGLTWAHRDRSQQTSGTFYDYEDGNIGPEVGQTYTLRLYGEEDTLVKTVTGLSVLTYDWATEADDSLIDTGQASNDTPTDWLAHWTMTNVSGSTLIDEGGNYNGTISGAVVSGNVMAFDGVNDYVAVTIPALGAAFTYAGFVTSYSDTSYTHIFSDSTQSGFALKITKNNDTYAGEIYFYDGTISRFFGDGTDLTFGVEAFVVLNYDGTDLKLYVDDTLIHSVAVSLNITVTNFRMSGGPNSEYGKIDLRKVYIFDRSLTSVEMTALYNEVPPVFSYRKNGKVTYEISSVRDGYESAYRQTHSVLRYGYGFNYGLYYGGV